MISRITTILVLGIIYLGLVNRLMLYCEATGGMEKINNLLSGNITGDVVPSTYPVMKINQSANNDSTFYNFYKDELEDIGNEAMELMSKQRKVFDELRKKAKKQYKLFEDLAMGAQRQ